MDDVPEKSRRNLMLIASTIIAITFLKVPLEGKLLGVANLKEVDSWRTWTCVCIVLIYTVLRFHFSEKYQTERNNAKSAFQAALKQINIQLASTEFGKALNKSSRLVRYELPVPPTPLVMQTTVNRADSQGIGWNGNIIFNWCQKTEVDGKDAFAQIVPASTATYVISGFQQTKNCWLAARKARLFQWPALEIATPYVLATISFAIVFYKLGSCLVPYAS